MTANHAKENEFLTQNLPWAALIHLPFLGIFAPPKIKRQFRYRPAELQAAGKKLLNVGILGGKKVVAGGYPKTTPPP